MLDINFKKIIKTTYLQKAKRNNYTKMQPDWLVIKEQI